MVIQFVIGDIFGALHNLVKFLPKVASDKLQWRIALTGLMVPAVFFVALAARATEFRVNTTTQFAQADPEIASLNGGGFVMVWEDDSPGGDGSAGAIKARRFNDSGTTQGAEFLVNTTTSSTQSAPHVAALSAGGFVVVWQDDSASGGDTSGRAVRAQRFDETGVAQGAEFLVNTTTSGVQLSPAIAGLTGGGFVIAWQDRSMTGGDLDGDAIRAQRYDASGGPQGAEFLVNTTTTSHQVSPTVAGLAGGGFVIAWQDQSKTAGTSANDDVRAQLYDAAGTAHGTEFVVNTTMTGDQRAPSAARLAGGDFVIAWQDRSNTGTDTSGLAVRAQRFNAAGAMQGAEFLANTTVAGNQSFPRVAALSGGGFVIAWDDGSGTGRDPFFGAVRAQRFDALNAPQGSEFLADTTVKGNQKNAVVAGLGNGGFVVGWTDFSATGGDTSSAAVRADIFAVSATVPATLFSSVLPTARTGFFPGGPAITVFATVINAGTTTGLNCQISIPAGSPVTLNIQQTDAANVPIGAADLSFDLAGGQTRSFILAFTPAMTSPGADIFPNFVCDNASVSVIPGVNLVFLPIGSVAGPDILSIGATPSQDGIINVPSGGVSFMTASAINIGAGDAAGSQDAAVSVSVDFGAVSQLLGLQMCETDAASQCLPGSPLGPGPVNAVIGNSASFFAIFVFDQASGGIPLNPADSRIFLRFKMASGTNLSVTSAAVTVP